MMRNVKRSSHRPRDLVSDTAVYDGRIFRGRVVFLGEGWRAEGPDGRSIGVFETRGEAHEAISEAGRR